MLPDCHNILRKGHLFDPVQAPYYRIMQEALFMVRRCSIDHEHFQQLWAYHAQSSKCKVADLVHNMRYVFKVLCWDWFECWRVRIHDRIIDILHITEEIFLHEVRDALRIVQWSRIPLLQNGHGRADMRGIAHHPIDLTGHASLAEGHFTCGRVPDYSS